MKITQVISVVLVLVTMSLSLSVFAGEKDVSGDEKLNAAKRYLQVTPISKIMEEGTQQIAQSLPPEKRNDFITNMKGAFRLDMLEKLALDSMMKTFTAEELNALADFYGSVLGKSITNKYGIYMAEVMPVLQQEMMRSLQKLQEKEKSKNIKIN